MAKTKKRESGENGIGLNNCNYTFFSVPVKLKLNLHFPNAFDY